ncbi:MAG: Lrp/AsnC family transcriptional regulator [Euryarchaeota archaeon]|nr:Lrp/AsnC family transcriptional regulator [Euryarchaeota archaeon]
MISALAMQDELDQRILQLLQKNGKLTYEEIGEILGRSPSTIRDRIKKMEESRTILGYSAIVDQERLGIFSDAYVSGDLEPERASSAISALLSIESVSEILNVTGERRVMIRVRARNNKELTDIINKKVRPLGFKNIETRVVLEPIVRYPGL